MADQSKQAGMKNFYLSLAKLLPTSDSPSDKEKRKKMFSDFDPNGNGYLSLAEIDLGIIKILKCEDLFETKPVLMRAYQAAKNCQAAKNKNSTDYVERSEFRYLLCYLRQYFEIFQMFETIDTQADRRLEQAEFLAAAPQIKRWGIDIGRDPVKTFNEVDKNKGGFILFDEFADWAIQKNLDLEDDDDFAMPKIQQVVAQKKFASQQIEKVQLPSKSNQQQRAELQNFYKSLAKLLPTGDTDQDKDRRKKMFKDFDPNGNGYLSLAEIDLGIVKILKCEKLFDAKPVLLRAYYAAKNCSAAKSKYSNDYVELSEFKYLLCYLRQFFEYFEMFEKIDIRDDQRLDLNEFITAAPEITSWGVNVGSDPQKTFNEIDKNKGGFILFDEFVDWAIQKNLDLEDDDDFLMPKISKAVQSQIPKKIESVQIPKKNPETQKFYKQLAEMLPTGDTEQDIARRKKMFSDFDPNANGYLSLAEIDLGMKKVLKCEKLFDAKPVLIRAYVAAKNCQAQKNKYSADYVERNEFKFLLKYLRQFFEIYEMFEQIDVRDDNRLDYKEFTESAPQIKSWGVDVGKDPHKTFNEIDKNQGGFILFDEFADWAIQRNLDLEDDDDLPIPQQFPQILIKSSKVVHQQEKIKEKQQLGMGNNYEISRLGFLFGDDFEQGAQTKVQCNVDLSFSHIQAENQIKLIKQTYLPVQNEPDVDVENSLVFKLNATNEQKAQEVQQALQRAFHQNQKENVSKLFGPKAVPLAQYLGKLGSQQKVRIWINKINKSQVMLSIQGGEQFHEKYIEPLQMLLETGLANISKEKNEIDLDLASKSTLKDIVTKIKGGSTFMAALMSSLNLSLKLILQRDITHKLKTVIDQIDPGYYQSPPIQLLQLFKEIDIDYRFSNVDELPQNIKSKLFEGEATYLQKVNFNDSNNQWTLHEGEVGKILENGLHSNFEVFVTIPQFLALRAEVALPELTEFLKYFGNALLTNVFK